MLCSKFFSQIMKKFWNLQKTLHLSIKQLKSMSAYSFLHIMRENVCHKTYLTTVQSFVNNASSYRKKRCINRRHFKITDTSKWFLKIKTTSTKPFVIPQQFYIYVCACGTVSEINIATKEMKPTQQCQCSITIEGFQLIVDDKNKRQ